ncbi:MAG: MBL fold metallo-hydrolase [Actinobacteria bacterium]|nr:MBL fold metallo-hydrolase [Actinomycetota bacterium]
MPVSIYPISLGVDHCYVLQDKGCIVIDGGMPNQIDKFKKGLSKLPIKPQDIRLILLTHGHWDHIGSARDIKEYTGAQLALHQREVDWLEKSLKPLPPGVTRWGRTFVRIMAMFMSSVHVPPAKVDMVLGDNEVSLAPYGIPGTIVPTPGHSGGSVSVLLESGEAFVGDLAMNGVPLRLRPGLPILAENMVQVRKSWELLLAKGVRTIYPAHGKPFSADVIRRALIHKNGAKL